MTLMAQWKLQDALDIYEVRHWGKGYFGINDKGHVTVHPNKRPEQAIDLKELVDQLQERGIQLPILLRFTDILRHRVGEIHDAFKTAINEFGYQGKYCCVYPIKVNQQRHVVEEILDFGKPFHFGLEAGSKPELLAVLAMTNGADTPIICNGFKDDEFIKMTVLARKMGKHIIPVVEKFTELETDRPLRRGAERAARHRRARQAGRTRSRPLAVTAPAIRSKFGLTLTEVLEAFEYLKQRGMADCLQLVHFHLGSQITNIRSIKNALTEAARDLSSNCTASGAGVKYLDVGGGLGVDYDGSQTDFESSRQLHAAGIRQRRRLPHQERLRRGRRAASDHHLRVGPGRGRLSQRAGLRRAGRVQLRPLPGAAGDPRRRAAAGQRPVRHLPRSEQEEPARRAITTPCRRWTRRSTCSTSAA